MPGSPCPGTGRTRCGTWTGASRTLAPSHWAPNRSRWGSSSKGLEVLDHGHALPVGQAIAEGVAGVAPPELARVVHLAALDGGHGRARGPIQDPHLPAQV